MARVSSHFMLKDPRFGSVVFEMVNPTVNATDANQAITPAQLVGGLIDRSIGAARTDTLPSAATLVEAYQGVMAGTPNGSHGFEFYVRNYSSGANTLTIAVGAGGTRDANTPALSLQVAQNTVRTFKLLFTNVTPGSEAYTLYSLGSGSL